MTFLTAGIRAGRACSAFCKAGFVLLIFPTTLHCHNFHIYLSPEFQTAEHDTDLSQTRAACSMRLPVQSFLSVNVNEWAHDCHFSIRAYLADKHFCFPDVLPAVTKGASAMVTLNALLCALPNPNLSRLGSALLFPPYEYHSSLHSP